MTGGEHRDPANFTVGSEVAGYRLEEQIGRGGMAVVYRARDVQLGRNVALKLLSPVLALDDAFRQRFIRESRAAAAVDHPYIIPIFAAGESDGALFIAMRYVQGGDVRSLIDAEGPLPPDRAAGIIIQVALALDAAHLHGLVHRDIKPANMLLDSVAGSDQRDHVYLADFGLSKRSLSVTGLTSIGQFLGTPAYVAPEQVEGRPVDSRADQYALACASFEILSGAPPYERDDDLAVMWAHVSVPPPSLSERQAQPARGGRRGAGQGDGEGTGRSLPDVHRLRPGPAPGARCAGEAGRPDGPRAGAAAHRCSRVSRRDTRGASRAAPAPSYGDLPASRPAGARFRCCRGSGALRGARPPGRTRTGRRLPARCQPRRALGSSLRCSAVPGHTGGRAGPGTAAPAPALPAPAGFLPPAGAFGRSGGGSARAALRAASG